LARLRVLVPVSNAVVGIDLADRTQSVVLVDTDSRVLARRRVSKRAWELGPVLDWARTQAHRAGFTDATVACEPTGHRWRIIAQLADQHRMPMVCVQPLLVARSREAEDYTRDKTDEKDAVLIARLARELRCYQPEPPDATWARLRHLGVRRTTLISEATACRLRLRDLLECCWPAVLDTAAQPLDSTTWQACLAVVAERCAGDPGSLTGPGLAAFTRLARAELPRWGGTRLCHRIVRAVFAALGDDTGVATQRPGGLERVGLVLADWHMIQGKLADTQTRMLAVLDELGLTDLLGSIPGSLADRRRGDPGRNRRPDPVQFTTGPGQTRRAEPTTEHQRHPARQNHHLQTGPSRPADRRVARGLGCAARQPGAGRPLPASDHPRRESLVQSAGPHRAGRGAAALDPCREHPPPTLEPGHRHRHTPRPTSRPTSRPTRPDSGLTRHTSHPRRRGHQTRPRP
jgi:hypothetical protein